MSADRTILMTGGTGFLGSHLILRLVREDFRILLLKRSSSNPWRIQQVLDRITAYDIDETDVERVVALQPIDVVIHCATNYGRGNQDSIGILESNVVFPLTILELARKNQIGCFINTDTILGREVSPYSLAKNQFKEWFKLYAKDLRCINISLEHFYGPYDDESKFVTYLIKSMIHNVPLLDLTPGEQKRDFIYIDDVVEAFIKIMGLGERLGKGFYHYEVGTNQTIEIRKLVALIKNLAGNRTTFLNFGALPYRENEIMESHVETSEIRKLGWKPEVSLEEGLRRTIQMEKSRGDV